MLQLRAFQLLSAWLALGTAVRTGAPPRVVGSSEPVRVPVGADVVLPCRLEPRSDAEALTVEWTRPDPTPAAWPRRVEYVLFYRDGREVPDLKLASYARRAALFPERLKHGNLSLSLRSVTPADQGSYRCFVPTLRGPGTAATVQLLVGEMLSEESTAPPRTLPDPEEHREAEVTGGRLHHGALVPVGVGLLLLLVGGVGVCLHKRNHGNPAVRTSRLLQPS